MILIVGGGLAGISAALEARLNNPEKEVVLLEARNRLGGATWSFEKNGVSYDNGQHVFLRCCTDYIEFLNRIGSLDSVYLQPKLHLEIADMNPPGGRKPPRYAAIKRRGKSVAGSLLMYKHLKPKERIRAARTALALRKLDPADESLDEISFGDWLAGRGESANALEALWNLIVLPTVNVRANEASLKLAAKVFITGLLEDARGADIGWGLKPFSELHDQAAQKTLKSLGVKVHLNARVQDVEFGDENLENLENLNLENGAHKVTHKVFAGGETYLADTLILALAHNQLSDALPKGAVLRLLGEKIDLDILGTSPIINAHFVFDQKIMEQQMLAGINTEVQYIFDRTQAAGVDPKAGQCLAISLSGADKYLPQNAKEIESFFHQELLKMFPAAAQAELLHTMVTRENTATFRGTPGTHRHRAKTRTLIKNVYMAGAWTDTEWPATMEGAVRSGKAAAQMALGQA